MTKKILIIVIIVVATTAIIILGLNFLNYNKNTELSKKKQQFLISQVENTTVIDTRLLFDETIAINFVELLYKNINPHNNFSKALVLVKNIDLDSWSIGLAGIYADEYENEDIFVADDTGMTIEVSASDCKVLHYHPSTWNIYNCSGRNEYIPDESIDGVWYHLAELYDDNSGHFEVELPEADKTTAVGLGEIIVAGLTEQKIITNGYNLIHVEDSADGEWLLFFSPSKKLKEYPICVLQLNKADYSVSAGIINLGT